MKEAVIDLGSNSIRLLVVRWEDDLLTPLYRDLIMTRLGRGVAKDNLLDDISMTSTLEAIVKFREKAIELGCEKIRIFGTSALREAENSSCFIKRIEQSTGLKTDILSGEEEAGFSFIGARQGLGIYSDALVIDIGGGSTEFSIGQNQLLKTMSLPMGAVRFTNNYLSSDPPTDLEIDRANRACDELLVDFTRFFHKYSSKNVATIGVGGTLTTLAAIHQGLSSYDPDKVHGFFLRREEVDDFFSKLSLITSQEKKGIAGLSPERADIIVAGTLIACKVMEKLHIAKIQVSEWDLMEGYLIGNC